MRVLPLLLIAVCAGCAPQGAALSDRSTHVERVLEDVSAMIEGMTGAHTESRVVLRGPDYHSSEPRAPE